MAKLPTKTTVKAAPKAPAKKPSAPVKVTTPKAQTKAPSPAAPKVVTQPKPAPTSIKTTGTGTAPNASLAKPTVTAPKTAATAFAPKPSQTMQARQQATAQASGAPQSYLAPIYDVGGKKLGDATVVNGVSYVKQGNSWVPVKDLYGGVQWNPQTKSMMTTGMMTPQEQATPQLDMSMQENPDLQQFADMFSGAIGDLQSQMADMIQQQQGMSAADAYKLAEQYLKPQYDQAQNLLQQQYSELNRQAGLGAEARGLSGSMLEDVSKTRNLQTLSEGLKDIYGQYMAGVQQAGGQDYETTVQKLNNIVSQMQGAYGQTSNTMQGLLDQYLNAWKGKQDVTTSQKQQELQTQELAQDKWYKTEVLKDADARFALDQEIARMDAALRQKELSVRQSAQAQGIDPFAYYNAYTTVLGNAQEAMKTGDFSVASALVRQAPIGQAEKNEMLAMIESTKQKLAVGKTPPATSGGTSGGTNWWDIFKGTNTGKEQNSGNTYQGSKSIYK